MKSFLFSNGSLVSSFDDRNIGQCQKENIERSREFATSAIIQAGIDEKAQINAIAGIYPPERCEAIKSYIAACRNEYLRCKALILSAQTNDEADAVQFLAPPVPSGL
jgi:hypothetical protein